MGQTSAVRCSLAFAKDYGRTFNGYTLEYGMLIFFLGILWGNCAPFHCGFKSLHLAMDESFLKPLIVVANNWGAKRTFTD